MPILPQEIRVVRKIHAEDKEALQVRKVWAQN